MSFKVKSNDIYITRGDTCSLRFAPSIKGSYGENVDYVVEDGSVCRFQLKKKLNDNYYPILTKDVPIDSFIMTLSPDDTSSLDVGAYYYDVQLSEPSGKVSTYIPSDPSDVAIMYICQETDRPRIAEIVVE